jgi:hypothetical protein
MSGDRRVACTMDVGSTSTGFSFAALSCHFIDESFVMSEKLLRISYFETPHTGLTILEKLISDIRTCFPMHSSLNERSLKAALISITRDCVSSNSVAMRRAEGVFDVLCIGHRLKTLIDHVESLEQFEVLVSPMFKVLDIIKRSTKNLTALQKVQEQRLSQLERRTRKDVVKFPCNLPRTRWTHNPAAIRRGLDIHFDIRNMKDEDMYFKSNNSAPFHIKLIEW